MVRNFQFLVAFLAFAHSCYCQSNSFRETLTLSKAIEVATQNYPSIKRKLAEREASQFEFNSVQTNYLPSLILQGQVMDATSNQLRGTFFPNEGTAIPVSGGIKVNGYTYDAVWTSFVTGLINWKFFNFGKYKAGLNVARANMTAAEADYQNEIFQHVIKVCDSYLVDLILRDMLRSQIANMQRVKALRDVTSSFVKAGLKPGVDSSLVNAEYSKATLQFLEAQRMSKEQDLHLKEMLGLLGEIDFVIDTTIFEKQVPHELNVSQGFETNPRLAYYKSLVDYNKQKITSIYRSELPSISLLVSGWGRGSGISDRLLDDGSFIYNKSFSAGVPLRAYNYMVGISTIWNVTSLFKTRNESKAQQAVTRMADEKYREEFLAVQTKWEQSQLRYERALEALRQAPIQLQAARDAYAQAKARYDAGLSTILELTQTYVVLNRAEVDVALVNGNVWRALLQYSGATGDLTLFTDNF